MLRNPKFMLQIFEHVLNIYPRMFIAALILRIKLGLFNSVLIWEGLNKLWDIHKFQCYLAIKISKI